MAAHDAAIREGNQRSDLGSRSGKLATLFYCAQIVGAADASDPLFGPATREAATLFEQLDE